jgi:cytidylate kinase
MREREKPMAIITISKGSYTKGKEVAEKVAQRLNYQSVSREVILEASEDFNIPELKLTRALHDAPSIFERFTFSRERYLAYIASEILLHCQKDNVVYHGLAGHFFVRHIGHVLKVRIIADFEERVQMEMERENVSREDAAAMLKKDDHERREWSRKLYGVDTRDPSLYDLVIHIHKLTVDDAVDLICQTAAREQFKATPDSQRALDDLTLAARVRAAVVEHYPKIKVIADGGEVMVHVRGAGTLEPEIIDEVKELAQKVSGVRGVKVHLVPTSLYE